MLRAGLALLGAAIAACSHEHEVADTTAIPAVRIADVLAPSDVPGVLHGADVTLDRQTRRVLVLPATSRVAAELVGPPAARRYRLELPEDVRAWERLLVVREPEVAGRTIALWPAVFDLAAGQEPYLPIAPGETPPPSTRLTAYAAPEPEAFDAETRPFVVPADATLAFTVAVLAPARRATAPAEARITVLEGVREREIWRAELPGMHEGWRHERVSLAAFAERTVRLRFASRPGAAPAARHLAVFGEPVVLAPRRRPPTAPNVVLISMDTLRAHSVGAYGAERQTTPALDALAADGVLFEDAYSTAAFTLPGHMSMFTGLWLRSHASLTPLMPLAPEHPTLPEILRAAGYATGAFTSAPAWIMSWLGFRRGMDVFDEIDPPIADPPPPAEPCEAFTRGLDWMRARRDRPFFVFLHSYQVHFPYTAPPPYDRLYEPVPPGPVEGEYRRYRYEQEVRYADDQLRAFLEGLAALGVADRTLVIVTSDHGEGFGEHGLNDHTSDLYDEIARVPLVLRLPGALPRGHRVAEPVSVADLLPTVLDLLGLPPLPDLDGTSLLPLATGAAERLPREGVLTEAQSEGFFGWVDLTAVRTRTHTCMYRGHEGRTLCFDRRVDPWEREAPLPDGAASPGLRTARAWLDRLVIGTPPVVARWSGEVAEGTAGPVPEGVLTPERRNWLKALGYLDE